MDTPARLTRDVQNVSDFFVLFLAKQIGQSYHIFPINVEAK